MCLNPSPDLLFSYLSHLESRGLSEQYTEKIDDYIGKYLRAFKEVSFQSAKTFLPRSVHLMPRTRARYSAYLKGFLGYYGIPFDIGVKIPRSLPPYISEAETRKLYQTIRDKETHKESCFRDLTLMNTAVTTGMRRGELANH
jgi:integrase